MLCTNVSYRFSISKDLKHFIFRNNRKCIEARRSLVIATKNMEIYCRRLNLEDFDSIRDFVLKLDTGNAFLNFCRIYRNF